MRFEIKGPFEVPRTKLGVRVSRSKTKIAEFWDEAEKTVPGISTACGCYLAAVRNVPWYLGKASRQTFEKECFTPHKLDHYDDSIKGGCGVLYLFFIVRVTQSGKFSKPSKNANRAVGHRDVDLLEKLLIGSGLQRNPRILNNRETKLLREMVVPGFLNTGPGKGKAEQVKAFKRVLHGVQD